MASEPPSPPIALVTAGTAGLGAAVAMLLARNGMRVAVNYHGDAQRAAALVAELQAISTLTPAAANNNNGRVNYYAIKADLAVRADVERLVEEAVAVMGPPHRLDVVFSNGGWTRMRDIMDLEEAMFDEDWDRCFAMNVKSHLWLMHAAKPYLEAAYSEAGGAASFITTASLAGVRVSGSSLAYSVTKAAQLHLAKGLALISAPKIRVNSVSPGVMLTEWGLKFPPEKIKATHDASRLKRLATVEDVAEQVLCFIRAKSVTGQNMVIEGGIALP